MKSLLPFTGIVVAAIMSAGALMSTSNDPAVRATTYAIAAPTHLPATVAPVLRRACRDCHSDETVWPWYSHILPVSLLMKHDVETGRSKFNFSRWAEGSSKPTANQVQEICDAVSDHSMPPKSYSLMHRDTRLSDAEVDALCGWANLLAQQNGPSPAK
jgi:hypothetical protein